MTDKKILKGSEAHLFSFPSLLFKRLQFFGFIVWEQLVGEFLIQRIVNSNANVYFGNYCPLLTNLYAGGIVKA